MDATNGIVPDHAVVHSEHDSRSILADAPVYTKIPSQRRREMYHHRVNRRATSDCQPLIEIVQGEYR